MCPHLYVALTTIIYFTAIIYQASGGHHHSSYASVSLPQPPLPHPFASRPLPTILRDNRGREDFYDDEELSASSDYATVEELPRPLQPLAGTGATGTFIIPSQVVFDETAPKNVSAITGNSAYLHCVVHNLANKSVSWIRQRDLHILTVGRYTYTTDERYEVIHSRHSSDWILKIKYAQERDSGNYECQVSTKPIISYVVHLKVFTAPQAAIIGSPDMYVNRGSTINLTCIITHSPEPPKFIQWKHNRVELSYNSPRGGITMVTERGNTTTTGYLLMKEARSSDTGNYTCAPSNASPAELRLHVLDGELPAAMQTNVGVRLSSDLTMLVAAVGSASFILSQEVTFPHLTKNLKLLQDILLSLCGLWNFIQKINLN